MSDIFYDTASIDYPIIDADAHVNEPPNLWQDRMPKKWKQRAPRLHRGERGDIWLFDDGAHKVPMGLTCTAGQSDFELSPTGGRYDEMRPASFDGKARLQEMTVDGIYAQLLYPSVALKGARIYSDERELQLACVRAYNDWLANEFCAESNGRLIPLGILPTTGIQDGIDELDSILKAGHRGAIISAFPNGSHNPMPEDDAFWARAVEADIPVIIHIGSFVPEMPKPAKTNDAPFSSLQFLGKAAWTKAGGQTLGVVCDILFSGIFERFPTLKILLVESNIGWIPTLTEQADDMFKRYRWYTGAVEKMTSMPSEIFYRNFYATFMVDTVGVELRHRMNLDHIMWSTDYPHSGSDWPNSRDTIERVFRGVPKQEVKQMLHGNCKALFKLDHISDRLSDL